MIEMGSFPEACRLKPYGHQVVGVRALVESLESRWRGFLLADEPGAMKTKQVIDAAQVLFEAGKIDAVIVLTIAEARPLWYDPDPAFGEIAMHTWEKTPTIVTEWHSRPRAWANGAADREGTKRWLRWYCSNYEYVRNKPKAEGLAGLAAGPRTLLVLDESAAIRNHTSAQFKTAFMIRCKCA
ncbi:MAG TPA: hypothetical protein VFP80_09215, partial [Thermoanaerobaculia bacterium]|nr:hypothetical protein [Thermoanaerobaculia bacterium]